MAHNTQRLRCFVRQRWVCASFPSPPQTAAPSAPESAFVPDVVHEGRVALWVFADLPSPSSETGQAQSCPRALPARPSHRSCRDECCEHRGEEPLASGDLWGRGAAWPWAQLFPPVPPCLLSGCPLPWVPMPRCWMEAKAANKPGFFGYWGFFCFCFSRLVFFSNATTEPTNNKHACARRHSAILFFSYGLLGRN